ncbi:hypothetical protein Bbelb_433870, partial [Branchiostoma belcheri]
VTFPRPVVAVAVIVYLASDGITLLSDEKKTISVSLIDTEGREHDIGSRQVPLSCKQNPVEVSVVHDLTAPFYHTKAAKIKFMSKYIAISAIALRSSDILDPVAISRNLPPTALEVPSSSGKNTPFKILATGMILYTNWACPGVNVHMFSSTPIPAGDENIIRCEEDGLWSLPQAFCQLICGPPPKQENANLATQRCLDTTNHHVGTSCKFRCKRGYHVVGTSSHRRVFRRSCSEEGLWQGPTCERVKCKPPPPKFKGLYNCTRGFDYQSKCNLRCGENDKMGTTITCQRDGSWNGVFNMCKNLKGDCPKIQTRSDVAFQCKGSSIADKYEKMAKSKMTMNTVKDVLLTCTGGLVWYPDPLDVGCVEECSKEFIDDGWCDQQNNRAFCNYDGGDCCESTNANMKVQPFPANCKEECRCKDPNAIENRNGKSKDKSKDVSHPSWDRETNYSEEVSAEKLNEYSYNDKVDDGFDYI